MFTISKNSPIPLHTQLLNELRHAILNGKLKPHEQLPGEYALIDELNISRSTIQRAWQTAQEEGLIYRVPAKGTFVAEPTATTTNASERRANVAHLSLSMKPLLTNRLSRADPGAPMVPLTCRVALPKIGPSNARNATRITQTRARRESQS